MSNEDIVKAIEDALEAPELPGTLVPGLRHARQLATGLINQKAGAKFTHLECALVEMEHDRDGYQAAWADALALLKRCLACRGVALPADINLDIAKMVGEEVVVTEPERCASAACPGINNCLACHPDPLEPAYDGDVKQRPSIGQVTNGWLRVEAIAFSHCQTGTVAVAMPPRHALSNTFAVSVLKNPRVLRIPTPQPKRPIEWLLRTVEAQLVESTAVDPDAEPPPGFAIINDPQTLAFMAVVQSDSDTREGAIAATHALVASFTAPLEAKVLELQERLRAAEIRNTAAKGNDHE
jgi:hypothetical protein